MADSIPSIADASKDTEMSGTNGAPAMSIRTDPPVDTPAAAQPPVPQSIPAPVPPPGMSKDSLEAQPDGPKKDGLNADVAAETLKPKPVEMVSVPQTPMNGGTPAGASPRPELEIADETKDEKPTEPTVISEAGDKVAAAWQAAEKSIPEPITDIVVNGPKKLAAEMTGALQDAADGEKKRKLENGASAKNGKQDATDDAAKKAKVETAGPEPEGGAEKRKPGRPKKDKTAAPVVGKTARKTRSQGVVDV